MSRRSRFAGFTLLEVTVTLALLGIVLSIVYGVFAQTLAGKERAERRSEGAAAARAALGALTRDLTSLRPMTATASSSQPRATPSPGAPSGPITARRGVFLGRVHSEGGAALDDLAFTATLRRPTAVTFAATDLGIVHYFVAPEAGDSRRRALYRETVFSLTGEAFDPDKPTADNAVMLLSGVREFDLRYFDGKDWVPEWDSTDARNFAAAPFAVEIVLTVADESDESETYETAVDLPMMRAAPPPRPGGEPRT